MTAPDPVGPPAPLSPLRIGTSVAMIVGGLALALFARATYGRGLRLTELKWTAIAIYGTSALALLALAIPVAHGRTWATRVAALAAITPAGLWLIMTLRHGAPRGVFALAGAYVALAALALACRRPTP
ncbi:MAG: hypothetical protein IPH44_41830 [Myxococcales bacterium]|nr:hypothetical protein [Myxococcales bacterium]MBK7197490.1 hypothetical protein [Myxococcales bacterium]MBP6846760.1 hypothetical protein [Kofleriaceae bacterium]